MLRAGYCPGRRQRGLPAPEATAERGAVFVVIRIIPRAAGNRIIARIKRQLNGIPSPDLIAGKGVVLFIVPDFRHDIEGVGIVAEEEFPGKIICSSPFDARIRREHIFPGVQNQQILLLPEVVVAPVRKLPSDNRETFRQRCGNRKAFATVFLKGDLQGGSGFRQDERADGMQKFTLSPGGKCYAAALAAAEKSAIPGPVEPVVQYRSGALSSSCCFSCASTVSAFSFEVKR